ncbi:hypothetical protein HNY73_018946 [Argiope bruennichi]|uniref:Uncharacterized protein n=1 Tax=Argiope bruennichi TaxID=94029 RepID=A0A8T0EFA6_ARGBR|nr:hypothetical protein HNY73_018946 [Argiope bruennichi]
MTPYAPFEKQSISEEQTKFNDELSYCENHFERTHIRKPCGRYSVSLPFKHNIEENVNLGYSRTIASKRLDQLWIRLDSDARSRWGKLGRAVSLFKVNSVPLDQSLTIKNEESVSNQNVTKLKVGSQASSEIEPFTLWTRESRFFLKVNSVPLEPIANYQHEESVSTKNVNKL